MASVCPGCMVGERMGKERSGETAGGYYLACFMDRCVSEGPVSAVGSMMRSAGARKVCL